MSKSGRGLGRPRSFLFARAKAVLAASGPTGLGYNQRLTMTQAGLHQNVALNGERTGKYLGVDTALSFAGPAQELTALRSGCGVFDLNWRALIHVNGKDRVRWLHNMVSNNIRDLQPNRGNYNFVLNAQGRILADLYVFNRGESLLIQTDRNQVEALLATIKRFIIMDKVELSDAGDTLGAIGIAGPQAAQTLAAAGLDVSGMQPLEIHDAAAGEIRVRVISGPEQKPHWFEIWLDPAHAQAFAKQLTDAGAQPAGAEALEIWRVLRGIPQYGKDIRDRDLPQETGQVQALNSNKGCYIGQEIVERIRSRGAVHRKFTGFEFEDAVPAVGKFDMEGRTVAELTSTAHVPGTNRAVGLGYVRVDAIPSDGAIDLNGCKTKIVELPFAGF